MNHSGSPGIRAVDVWEVLRSAVGTGLNLGKLMETLAPLSFYDEFNRTAEDTDVWTSAGDGGTFTLGGIAGEPTCWIIDTGNVLDDDWYINGFGTSRNKIFSLDEEGYTTVTWEARLRFTSVSDISAMWGLFTSAFTSYAEQTVDVIQFLADPVLSNTFRARSYDAAEEETDTLIALDTAYHRFKIVWTATSVLFYIDDVLVATHVTEVPDDPLGSIFLIRTEAAAAKGIHIDYLYVEVS